MEDTIDPSIMPPIKFSAWHINNPDFEALEEKYRNNVDNIKWENYKSPSGSGSIFLTDHLANVMYKLDSEKTIEGQYDLVNDLKYRLVFGEAFATLLQYPDPKLHLYLITLLVDLFKFQPSDLPADPINPNLPRKNRRLSLIIFDSCRQRNTNDLELVLTPLSNALNNTKDPYLQQKSAELLSLLLGHMSELIPLSTMKTEFLATGKFASTEAAAIYFPLITAKKLLGWTVELLSSPNQKFVAQGIHWLGECLNYSRLRYIAFKLNSLKTLVDLTMPTCKWLADGGIRKNIQFCYKIILSIWFLSMETTIAQEIPPIPLFRNIVNILTVTQSDKVVRTCVGLLANLSAIESNRSHVIDAGFRRLFDRLYFKGDDMDDEFYTSHLKTLKKTLNTSLYTLTSWEKFKKQLNSGVLIWSQMHKSDAFWASNAIKLDNDEFALLGRLVSLLGPVGVSSGDSCPNYETIAVACHDLAKFMKYYPRGRHHVTRLGARPRIFELMLNSDKKFPESVQNEALYAVQTLMIKGNK